MSESSWVTIGVFLVGNVAAVVYAVGKIVQRLKSIEDVLKGMGEDFKGVFNRLDKHGERLARIESRCRVLHPSIEIEGVD